MPRGGSVFVLASCLVAAAACERTPESPAGEDPGGQAAAPAPWSPPEPSPPFRNVDVPTAYVGDEACADCHEAESAAYASHGMARSFHRWTPDTRVEPTLEEAVRHGPSGYHYAVIEEDGALWQEELILAPGGRRLHELRRRMDWVMGSGNVARTYFTEENGRLFQLPLTWYEEEGWDFSPGYEVNNARFERLLPDRCLACHGSYPEPIPFLEGKYAELEPGIGCERCHGPGALHVREREAGEAAGGEYDDTIVSLDRLPFERRLDACEQCHVHTPVTVLREGHDAFDYIPSKPLEEHAGFFKAAGSIDIVSHADRLRQSACFLETRASAAPLECSTCHDPHGPTLSAELQNRPCLGCHAPDEVAQRVGRDARPDHGAAANCVECHMPSVAERTVPHGQFTDHWIRVLDGAVATDPAGPRTGSPIEPYFARDRSGPDADLYRAMGEVVYATLATDGTLLREAAAALEAAVGSDSTRADALFLLGAAHRQLGRTDEAIAALEASLAAAPDRPQRLHALARAYESAGREPGAVEALYERALELQPALAFVRADYARFLQAAGRVAEAEAAYRAALEERPSLATAAFNLGTLLAGRERFEEATRTFRTAVTLEPAVAEALSPLLQVRASAERVVGVRSMGSPIESLPVRSRGPGAVRLTVSPRGGRAAAAFVNVPPGAAVRIAEPDGTPVRTLPAASEPTRYWDLQTGAGAPVAGGLYRAEVRPPDGGPPQRFYFGIVRSGG